MFRLILVSIVVLTAGCTENFQRKMKNVKSDWLGGLERECTVYSMSGSVIKKYTGRFDLKTDGQQILFDRDGKRVIIQNATVICEEL